jgi:DNA-binding transcriptional LysR family regulator
LGPYFRVLIIFHTFIDKKHLPILKTLSLATFEEDCIFRRWALEGLEKAGIDYRIVYVSRSISGLLDSVKAGFAIAPIIGSNVPPDLKILGIEDGLPVLPVSNIVLHKSKINPSEIIDCFSKHLIKAFREKTGS